MSERGRLIPGLLVFAGGAMVVAGFFAVGISNRRIEESRLGNVVVVTLTIDNRTALGLDVFDATPRKVQPDEHGETVIIPSGKSATLGLRLVPTTLGLRSGERAGLRVLSRAEARGDETVVINSADLQ